MKKYGFLLLFVTAALSGIICIGAEKPVKYVFLFIGDGLSSPQRMMASEYCKRTGKKDLLINSFPVSSQSTTYALNAPVTDSAASGTAIACGSKTYCGAISVDGKGKPLESIAASAHKAGRRVGVITSVSIDHATPAVFYAHNVRRSNYYQIGVDLTTSDFEFFCGGFFKKPSSKNKPNTYELAKKSGYTVIKNKPGFNKLKPGCGKVLAVFRDSYVIDKNPQTIDLPAITSKGIELLDNPKGFFMMVEGGRIDWGCHANDAATVLKEILEFDSAVKVAYEFAKKHPNETLIVVTGDHETGALTTGFAGAGFASNLELLKNQKVSGDIFSRQFKKMIRSKDCSYENARKLLTQYFGFKFTGDSKDPMVLSENQKKRLKAAYDRSLLVRDKKKKQRSILYGSYDPFSVTAVHVIAEKAGLGWNSYGHSALPVVTCAYGVDAAAFENANDNTDIAKLLRPVVSVPVDK